MSEPSHPIPPIAALPLHESLKGMALVLFSVLIWSGWTVISRAGATGSLTAYDITALRFGVSGLILLPVLWRKGFGLGPYGIKGGIAIMALMGAPYAAIVVEGMTFIPISQASAVINACMLTTTYLFGYYILKEPIGRLQISGIFCCLSGIVVILIVSTSGSNPHAWIGHLCCAIGGCTWGAYGACNKAWRLNPLHATAAICGYSFLFYLPVYFLFLPKLIMSAPHSTILFQAVYQGIINSILALLAYNRGIAILGATRASAFIPLVPVLSTLLAIPVLGEHPSSMEWLGVALVAVGVLLACGIVRIIQARLLKPFPA